MRRLKAFAFSPSEREAEIIGLALVVVGCAIDFYTGPEYSLLLFYIPPIIYVAWFSSAWFGWIYVALIAGSILAIHLADEFAWADASGADYNAFTRMATVAFVYWIVRNLRRIMIDLRNAKVRLEELNREKDMLFGIISHDLKSPFNAMLGFAQLMERTSQRLSPEKIREYARGNYAAAQRAFDLLENLLYWARLRMNRASSEPRLLDAGALVADCIETLRSVADEKRVDVAAARDDTDLRAFADPDEIETVLRNLVSNAIKFTPPNGRVTVTACATNGALEISVVDTGVGIPDGRLPHLLSLSSVRATPGTDGQTGTGLGLVLCKELVERNGGSLTVASTPGEGSQFSFTIPSAPERNAA